MIALVALWACQGPGAGIAYRACEPGPSAAPRAKTVDCADELSDAALAEGRGSDLLLTTDAIGAVIRHPEAALGRVGQRGGTLIDATPWGSEDTLYEVVPVVGGAWLDVDAWWLDADGVTVEGLDARGDRRSVRWTADGNAITAEGADALWVHGEGAVLGGALWGRSVVRGASGPEGAAEEGAVLVIDGDTLVVSPTWDPDLHDATVPIDGTAPEAERVVLDGTSGPLGSVAVIDGRFAATVPAAVTRVRAEADGRAASAWVEVADGGEGLALALGGSGRVGVPQAPRPQVASWVADDGRQGRFAVAPGRGRALASLGRGSYAVSLAGGPTLSEGDVVFDPGSRAALVAPWYAARSREVRTTDADAVLDAVAAGADLVVLAPVGDVGEVPAEAPIAAVGGSTATGDGWSITAWPMTPDRRASGRGAVDPSVHTALSAFRALQDGDTTNRITVVDLGWLAAIGLPPADLVPGPDAVRLTPPAAGEPLADALGAWTPWFAWLDRGVALAPVGPITWAEVPDRAAFGRVDVERGLLRGEVVAGTGPVIELAVGRPTGFDGTRAIDVAVRGCACTEGALVADGRVLATFDPSKTTSLPRPVRARWLVAVARAPDGAWAVTGPVWTDPP